MRINQRSGPTRTLITDPPGPWHPTGGRQGARRGEANPLTAGLQPPSLDPSGAAPPAPTGAPWPSAWHVPATPKTGPGLGRLSTLAGAAREATVGAGTAPTGVPWPSAPHVRARPKSGVGPGRLRTLAGADPKPGPPAPVSSERGWARNSGTCAPACPSPPGAGSVSSPTCPRRTPAP